MSQASQQWPPVKKKNRLSLSRGSSRAPSRDCFASSDGLRKESSYSRSLKCILFNYKKDMHVEAMKYVE